MNKVYKLSKDEIRTLIPNLGAALATDVIMVEGNKVDFMSKEEPSTEGDSGWVFYGGGETQSYIDDPENTSFYSLNTIANYDPEIIKFLTYPLGTKVERNENGILELLDDSIPTPDTTYLQPVLKGLVQLTSEWSIEVNAQLFKRLDKGDLVLWRPGITIYIGAYESDISVDNKIGNILEIKSQQAFNYQEERSSSLNIVSYQLTESGQDSFYIFGFCMRHEISMAIYYDGEIQLDEIYRIKSSLLCNYT